ncbi:MAG: hypothetical protein OXI54_09945 [Chloroflexota bacterium]|nr:hypothetical protein [Chloroflexota bacterium]MDE2684452.1 hypothetical protein [Chloroflexota bacterium]
MRNSNLAYEANDASPPLVTLGVAAQGAVIAISNIVTITTVFVLAVRADADYLSWAVFASLMVAGIAIIIHGVRFGRLGAGHLLLHGATVPFLAVCVLAVIQGGLALMSILVVTASLVQFGMSAFLAKLSRVITPVVSGVALMVVALAAMPVAVARLNNIPPDAPFFTGPAVGAVSLITATVLMLRGSGLLRAIALPITIVIGCMVSYILGIYDFKPALERSWFDLPEFSAWPGFASALSPDFWALLPSFLIVSIVVALKASAESAVIQQVSRRIPRAIDFRSVQGTLNAGGLSILASGLLGILPVLTYLPSTISLISFTGVAARRVAYVVGAILIVLALFPKVVALMMTIPPPVSGSILMVIMGLLFVEGVRTVAQDGLNPQKAVIMGLALSISVGLQSRNILAVVLGDFWGVVFGNSVVGILSALLMSLVVDFTISRRRRLNTELDQAAAPTIDEFLRRVGTDLGWSDASVERLCAAGEETLSSMLELRDDYEDDTPPRLIVLAKRGAGSLEIEFMAVFAEENIEDRIAFMSEQAEAPDVSDISFRLLRHYASSVRHRKYHGIDVVTVQVDA